jgi:hypothetical protein
MAKTIEDLFFYFVFIFDVLIIGLAFYLSRKTTVEKSLWFITVYCLVNSAVNYSSTLHLPLKIDYFLFGFYTILEYTVFAYFIFYSIRNHFFRKLIKTFSLFFSVFVICYYTFGRVQHIDSIPIGIETILILIYSFYYFYERINDITNSTLIYNQHTFWIVVGIMIYLGGSFFIYIFANRVEVEILEQYWFLTYLFYILKSILFFIAFIFYHKQFKNSRPPKLRPYLN